MLQLLDLQCFSNQQTKRYHRGNKLLPSSAMYDIKVVRKCGENFTGSTTVCMLDLFDSCSAMIWLQNFFRSNHCALVPLRGQLQAIVCKQY